MINQLAHAVKPGMSEPDLVRLGINMAQLRDQGVPARRAYFLSSSVRPREITYCNCINYGPNDGLDARRADRTPRSTSAARCCEVGEIFRAAPRPAARSATPRAQRRWPDSAAPAPSAAEYEITEHDCVAASSSTTRLRCFGFIDNRQYFVSDAGVYGIPYRALIPLEMHQPADRGAHDDGGHRGAQQHAQHRLLPGLRAGRRHRRGPGRAGRNCTGKR